jgi:hypothetical protein
MLSSGFSIPRFDARRKKNRGDKFYLFIIRLAKMLVRYNESIF